MTRCRALSGVSIAVLWSATALAQDAVQVDPVHYKLVLENASVRVLRIDYPAGDKSKMHQHPDTIVIPLTTAKVRFTTADGNAQELDLANESAVFGPAVTHSVENIGTGPVDGILVEFKAAAPGTAVLPPSRDNLTMKVLGEGSRAVAYRVTATPTFQEPAGSRHDYDQIVVALADAQTSLSIDGKPAKTTWARGDVEFIGRGVPHETKNTGGKPVDFVIVAIR